ncbi:MAG: VOC family protein [Sneathiella sp.]|uniref:VOC family protein n=1 Tax=Sneathiella sp. TaxID=1964365 RepID=UPI003002BD64
MPHNIVGIDHSLIGVNDLEQAKSHFRSLGFTITSRGAHIGWGTANYCIMFDNDYIELLGIINSDIETNGLDVALAERGEGLLGLALASDDPEQTHASMVSADLNPSELLQLKRKLELPDGDVVPEFKLIRLQPAGLSEKQLFICHHLTPNLIRNDQWVRHANGATGIASIVVVVDDPASLASYYRKLCGFINVTMTDDTLNVRIGDGALIFVNDKDLDMLFPGLYLPADFPALPNMIAMSIAVKDLEATTSYLNTENIRYQEIANGALRINPADATGVLLEFVRER